MGIECKHNKCEVKVYWETPHVVFESNVHLRIFACSCTPREFFYTTRYRDILTKLLIEHRIIEEK